MEGQKLMEIRNIRKYFSTEITPREKQCALVNCRSILYLVDLPLNRGHKNVTHINNGLDTIFNIGLFASRKAKSHQEHLCTRKMYKERLH